MPRSRQDETVFVWLPRARAAQHRWQANKRTGGRAPPNILPYPREAAAQVFASPRHSIGPISSNERLLSTDHSENRSGLHVGCFECGRFSPDKDRGSGGPDTNRRECQRPHGMTPLDYAVEQNDIGSVLALIHAGADVNARSNTGRTALSWAALHGYIEIARALAQAGADLNVKDAQGGTPFTLAFEAGHFEVVQALIKAGADADPSQVRKDVNAQDGSGDTPLVHAAKRGDIASIRALVQLGADPNAPDMSGRTLLA